MKYSIEQYPKFKNFDKSQLSEYQFEIRNNQKKYKYSKTKTCTKCHKKLPIKEFYIRDKETGRRRGHCRDCQMREADILEIGKYRFADKILKSFDKPFTVGDLELYIKGSMGISIFPDDADDQDTLLKYADSAMYEAKKKGGNTYVFYKDSNENKAEQLFD